MADSMISFGSTVQLLKDATHGASETHNAIANNIANVSTPGFARTDVSFKAALAAEQGVPADPDQLALSTDQPNQIPLGGDLPALPFAVTKSVDHSEQMRVDGSNVDLDQEMAKLSINSGYSSMMHELLSNQYTRMRRAITETNT
ncbi:MAG: flagellar basal body rod protein FlgB [Candidatus Velthaea sp.]